jgi:hypothetical protein
MFYTMRDTSYSVAIFGDRAVVDATWFGYENGKVTDDKNRHVYTLYPDSRLLELGVDYQAWYDEDQVPVPFLEWTRRKSNRNIKNIIIHDVVYQIKNASCSWPQPSLFSNKKHVGYIIDDYELVWIGKNGKLQFQKTIC